MTDKKRTAIIDINLNTYKGEVQIGMSIVDALKVSVLESTSSSGGGLLGMLPMLFIMSGFYFVPTIIAIAKRNHRTKVILINIFLGWTIVMWILSLVWACKRDEENKEIIARGASPADEIKKYKDLLDSGAISQEEFEEKKKKLLNV